MLLFAMPGLVELLITILVFLIVIALIWYLVNLLAPEPLKKYALAIVIVVAVIFLIYFLLQIGGGGGGGLKL